MLRKSANGKVTEINNWDYPLLIGLPVPSTINARIIQRRAEAAGPLGNTGCYN
jgi:hypothetical protein